MKGVKKDEQYRILWNELETAITSSGKSMGHKQLMTCIRECRTTNPSEPPIVKEVIDVDEPASSTSIRPSVIRVTTDSPLSPPILTDTRKRVFPAGGGNRTLLDIFLASDRAHSQKRLDFSGRLCTPPGQIAKLYPQLQTKEAAREEPLKMGS